MISTKRLLLIWALLLAGLVCLAQTPTQAFIQSRDSNYNVNVVSSGGGGSATLAFQCGTTAPCAIASAGFAATQTFTAVPIGTAASDRVVVVGVYYNNSATGSTAVTGLTIGGVSATLDVHSASASSCNARVAIFHLLVTSGTTSNIIVSANAIDKVGIMVWSVNTATSTPSAINSLGCSQVSPNAAPGSATTVPASGVGAVATMTNASVSLTFAAGTTQDANNNDATNGMTSLAGHATSTGSWTPSIGSLTFQDTAIALATWSP